MTEIRNTTTLVGLFRWPTGESLSPPMQNAGFAALGLDWAYAPLPTAPERLADAVRGVAAAGFAGANVTMPHKQAAVALCDEVDEVAGRAGSVNTLVFTDGRVLGSSTDGDAVASQIEAQGRRALVLGAGGAALAVVEALERAGAEVTVKSRREPGWPPPSEGYDVLVNATPVKDYLLVVPRPGSRSSIWPISPTGPRQHSSPPPARPAASSSSTASTCSSFRAQHRSSAGQACPPRSSRCAPPCGRGGEASEP